MAELSGGNTLEVLYMLNCVIATIGYLPQACKLITDRSDSASVSLGTWGMWVYTGCVALFYVVLVNGDPLLILSSGINAFGCISIMGLLLFNRYGKKYIFRRCDFSLFDLIKKPAPAADIPAIDL